MVLFLTRTYFPDGTNGTLYCAGRLIAYSIELPWKQNAQRVSCIPEGKYFIRKRYSRTFGWHLEVVNVAHRSFILFHPANHALTELQGCIAPVSKLTGAGVGVQSRIAFEQLKLLVYAALRKNEVVVLLIHS